ncbi:DNA-binding transcriptional regulator, MerR family [Amycolatopsis arida]|uniref:DNA-binding transcriptional regulator, MerR family n=1 Tax=Amycolatopsis arida TaxID=587909 RepID=A0A1I6AVL7_9PSEU|nr:heavy metal-responsive transcriptional regulator [Amycolatopsis arida]TDX85410.1 DNA-binding transcriptional MerR regulator [Amycolatopsis arida]SFQ72734.1 DNA-binding transcriptional regulator, MerR family [Amycolatopsis arida]
MPGDLPIGALAARVGVNTKTIRYYEQIGLLPSPRRTSAGHRRYEVSDAERVTFIRTAQRLGLTLDEIRQILLLQEDGQQPCDYVRQVLRREVARIDRRIAELTGLREQLTTLDRRPHSTAGTGGCICRVIEDAPGLRAGAGPPRLDVFAERSR